jgi:hypothetical protein
MTHINGTDLSATIGGKIVDAVICIAAAAVDRFDLTGFNIIASFNLIHTVQKMEKLVDISLLIIVCPSE